MVFCYVRKNGYTIRVPRKEAGSYLAKGFRFDTKENFARSLDRNWDTHIFKTPLDMQKHL